MYLKHCMKCTNLKVGQYFVFKWKTSMSICTNKLGGMKLSPVEHEHIFTQIIYKTYCLLLIFPSGNGAGRDVTGERCDAQCGPDCPRAGGFTPRLPARAASVVYENRRASCLRRWAFRCCASLLSGLLHRVHCRRQFTGCSGPGRRGSMHLNDEDVDDRSACVTAPFT